MGRPKKAEPTESIRLPQSSARQLRRLALHHKQDPGDYFKEQFGESLNRLHMKMLTEQMKESGVPAAGVTEAVVITEKARAEAELKAKAAKKRK